LNASSLALSSYACQDLLTAGVGSTPRALLKDDFTLSSLNFFSGTLEGLAAVILFLNSFSLSSIFFWVSSAVSLSLVSQSVPNTSVIVLVPILPFSVLSSVFSFQCFFTFAIAASRFAAQSITGV